MKRSFLFMPLIISIAAGLLFTSCGGATGTSAASAPPVDLPAPITGRIDISESDDSGNVTITGSEGAVTGSATVIAVNEAVAGEQGMMKIFDAIVPSAYAQSILPSVCSQAGRACVVAEADGSFIITLAASAGDSIAIGLVDPTSGSFVSARVRTTVPTGSDDVVSSDSSNPCAGLGLSGAAVDIVPVPDESTTIALRQGSDIRTNRVVIRTANKINAIAFNGCSAKGLAVTKVTNDDGTESVILAAISETERSLWTGIYNKGKVWNPSTLSLPGDPQQIAFVGSSTQPIVTLETTTTASMAKISLSDGSVVQTMSLGTADFTPVTISDLDVMRMQDDQNLGLVISHAADSDIAPLLTFFNADALSVISDFAGMPLDLTAGAKMATFFRAIDEDGNANAMGVAVVDEAVGGSFLMRYGLFTAGANRLYWDDSIADSTIGSLQVVNLPVNLDHTPVDIATAQFAQLNAVLPFSGFPLILMPMSDGWLTVATANLVPNNVPEIPIIQLPSSLSAISVADGLQSIAVLQAPNGLVSAVGNLFSWTN